VLAPALLIVYPFAVHTAIIKGYGAVALLVFLAIPLILTAHSLMAGLAAVLAVAAAITLLSGIVADNWKYLLYLMPVTINTALGIFFGRTLLPGKTPLITGFSIRMRGKLEPGVAGYTRRVTQLWTAFFILLAVESLMLALFAPVEVWSLFTNILNYLFAGLLFVGEYHYRVRHLDNLEHPGFTRFLRNLSKANPGAFNRR